jgi:F0F1-type ATP synthase assembly protein I
MAAGWIVGYFVIDRYFSIYPWGSISLTLLGAIAGLYEIMKILILDQRSKDDPHG